MIYGDKVQVKKEKLAELLAAGLTGKELAGELLAYGFFDSAVGFQAAEELGQPFEMVDPQPGDVVVSQATHVATPATFGARIVPDVKAVKAVVRGGQFIGVTGK